MSKYVNIRLLLSPFFVLSMLGYIRADTIDFDTGRQRDLSFTPVTYARAQKMRAAISHKFGRGFKIGTQVWCENPITPGSFYGNPSLSVTVSEYMISLRRRKVSTLSIGFD